MKAGVIGIQVSMHLQSETLSVFVFINKNTMNYEKKYNTKRAPKKWSPSSNGSESCLLIDRANLCCRKTLFSLDGDTLKSYNSMVICPISVQSPKKGKRHGEFVNSKICFVDAHFCTANMYVAF